MLETKWLFNIYRSVVQQHRCKEGAAASELYQPLIKVLMFVGVKNRFHYTAHIKAVSMET